MNIFTRKEERVRQDIKLDIVRQEELKISQALQDKIVSLNFFNKEMDAEIAVKRAELVEAQADLQNFLRQKVFVVEGLEARKKEALAPIVGELEELSTKRREVEEALATLELGKLDDTARKEQLSSQEAVFRIHEKGTLKVLEEREQEVSKRELGLANAVEAAQSLLIRADEAKARGLERESALQAREEALSKRELGLVAREKALKEERILLDKQAVKLNSVEARLVAAGYARS